VHHHRNVEVRRRARRLAPGVLLLCLVMILASALTLVTSPVKAAGTGGPQLPAGDYVTFHCPKGFIQVGPPLIPVCGTGQNTTLVCVAAPSCSNGMVATMVPGYPFGSWETSGDASVTCSTCSSTTLQTSDPNGGRYSGTVWQCVAGPVSFSSSATAQSTNVTVYFEPILPPGCSVPVSVTLTWGNTTSYSFTAISNQQYSAGTQYSVLIDYLQPGIKYYYKLVGTSSCCSQGTVTSNWTTNPESTYLSTYGIVIRGTVYDTGGATAPAKVQVEAQCTAFAASGYWTRYGVTNSRGQYSIIVGQVGQPYCPYYGFGYFAVQTENGWGAGDVQWNSHFNETFVIWAPQFVNFYLPKTLVTLVPLTYDYTHVYSAGVIANVTYTQSATLETTATSSYAGTGVVSTVSDTTSLGSAGLDNKSLEIAQNFSTSGDLRFNGIGNRTPWVDGVQFWGNKLSQLFGPPLIADWRSLSQYTSASCGLWDASVSKGYPAYTSMMLTGSITSTQGTALDFSLGVDIPGGAIGLGPSVSASYQVTFSVSQQTSASVDISILNLGSGTHVFYACFDGDASSTGGLVSHIWQTS
jgi:hypothetical protein